MRIPLLGGAYATRSVIAEAQRCVNLFPEVNPKTTSSPVTFYQRPGLRPLPSDPGANKNPVRAIYRASNDTGYCVIGQSVYAINANWTLDKRGDLLAAGAPRVIMTDNGRQLFIVDSSPFGYQIDLGTRNFSQIIDPAFTGAVSVDNIDTFCIWNFLNSRAFGSTLSNQITPMDPTYLASKTGYPDLLQRVYVNRNEILLIGTVTSEIWYDTGGAQFPFARLPGSFIEHGTYAPFSVASADIATFWLGRSRQGFGFIIKQQGYETRVISNPAISYAIRKMQSTVGISDATGYCYSQDGHMFYVLTFPAGDQTWVYDDSIGDPTYAWHQRGWTDGNGLLHRERGNCHAFINNTNVIGDWQNGTLYALDPDVYTDTVSGVKYANSYVKTFSHVQSGYLTPRAIGQEPSPGMGKRVQHLSFIADIEAGGGKGGPADANGEPTPDLCWLRWSDDRGRTFGNAVAQSLGVPGQWNQFPTWNNLGIARDRVYELAYSVDGPAALNGAWVQPVVDNT